MTRHERVVALRQALRSGKTTLGSWLQIPHGAVAEIMGDAGYDWIAVDLEHGSIGHHQLPDLFRAIELGGTLPLARVVTADAVSCKQALDAGAGGVILPMIETADQLRSARNACCWPPAGTRGVGFSRANLFGKHFDAYSTEAQAPLLVAMIESRRGVDEVEALTEVEGLDAILIGPYDLSASLGVTAQFEHSTFMAAVRHIQECCDRRAVPSGIHVVTPDPAALRAAELEGHRFIAYSLDGTFLRHAARRPATASGPSK